MKSKKYKLSATLFYSVIIAFAVAIPNMASALQSGDFTYTVSLGTVTITGYTGSGGDVVIPDKIDNMPVVRIGEVAFAGYSLTSVSIPDSVTLIGGGAFSGCHSLTSVTIGNSVTFIGKVAFADCALGSVTIPASVTSIEEQAFSFCMYLTKAYFLGNAPSTGQNVFAYCASGFTVCYTAGSKGFTTPKWCLVNPIWCSKHSLTCAVEYNCPPAKVCGASTTTTVPAPPCAAEAIYGRDSEETELLREYRDMVLSKTSEGQEIIKNYYQFSPAVTKLLEQRPLLKNRTKAFIDNMLPGIRKKIEESYKEP